MSDNPSSDFRSQSSIASPKRSTPNISGGWLVMILSFLVAMVIYFYVTQQSNQLFTVAVASQDIPAGAKVDSNSFRQVQVNLPQDQLNKLLSFDAIDEVNGFVAVGQIENGDPVLRSALREASASNGLRAMSIPIEEDRAVAGALVVGDRVDVIDTSLDFADGIAAKDLEVLSVASSAANALSGGGSFSITVAVNASDAINIARSINGGKTDLLRSTGATPLASSETPSS